MCTDFRKSTQTHKKKKKKNKQTPHTTAKEELLSRWDFFLQFLRLGNVNIYITENIPLGGKNPHTW